MAEFYEAEIPNFSWANSPNLWDPKAIFFYKSHFKNPLKNPASYLVEAGI